MDRKNLMFKCESNNRPVITHQNRFVWKKALYKIWIVILACGFFTGTVYAQSDAEASFGIRPTKAYEGKPETKSYFSYELTPGAQINDEALILNDGKVPVVLKLYAADGITAQNGGTSLSAQVDPSSTSGDKVSSWITLPVNQVSLEPGQQLIIPFTLTVPTGALPGQHVGGLVVESLPTTLESAITGNDQAQFSVNVIRRVGVAVVVDIPGPHISGLVVNQIRLETQNELGATFVVDLSNTGNVLTKAEGNLLVTDKDYNVLVSLPIKIDTILPGDSTIIYLLEPFNLYDGDYRLSVGLIYQGGTAILEGIDLKIRKGKPVGSEVDIKEGGSALEPGIQRFKPLNYSLSELWIYASENIEIVLSALLGFGFLFILFLGFLVLRKRGSIKKL